MAGFEFEFGVAFKQKTRDYSQQEFEDDNGDLDFDDPDDNITPDSGLFEYEEDRFDAWAMAEMELTPALTRATRRAFGKHRNRGQRRWRRSSGSTRQDQLNPSAHFQWESWENGQFRVSVRARCAARPLDQVVPFAQLGFAGG